MGIVPYCTVTVYNAGTTTIATTTPQSPFTANANGSINPISAAINHGYDVKLSGGIYPNTYSSPVTIPGLYPTQSFAPISGVTSINSAAGGFNFTGPGVSCTGTSCIFTSTSGVTGLNALTGALAITGDSSITVTPSGTNIALHATVGPNGVQYNPSTTTYYIVGDSIAGVASSCVETALPSDTAAITAGTVSGTTATFTASNTWSTGCVVTLSGFTGSYAPLNGQIVTVSSSGLSGSGFQAPVSGVSSGSTGAGQAQATYNLTGQLSLEPFIHGHGTVINNATSAQTIAQMLTAYPTSAHLHSPAITGNPAFLIIFTGTQDLYSGTSLATMESGMQAYWSAARADGWTGIIQTTVTGYSATGLGAAPESQWTAFNAWLMAQGPTAANVAANEYWDRIASEDKWLPNAFDANYFIQAGGSYHLTDMGAKVAADMLNLSFSAQGSDEDVNLNCTSVYGCPNLAASNTFTAGPQTITGSGPTAGWQYTVPGGRTIGMSGYSTNLAYLYTDGAPDLELIAGGAGVQVSAGSLYGFLSGSWVAGTLDTALSRDSAGVIDVGNGAVGDTSGSIKLTNVTASGTVAAGSETLGSPLLPASGGTGATTAAGALANLGGLPLSGGIVTGTLQLNPYGTATSLFNYGSHALALVSSFWNGSSAAVNQWTIADVLGTGSNPTSTLTFLPLGTSGTKSVSLPQTSLGNGSTATTQSPGDASTKVATDAFVGAIASNGCLGGNSIANGCTGATTAAGANLAITGVTQTGALGTSSQKSTFPGVVAIGAADTALSRDSAGVIDVGNGAVGDTSGSIKLTNVTASGTVAAGAVVTPSSSFVPFGSATIFAGDSICANVPGQRWSDLIQTMSQFTGRVAQNVNTCVSGYSIANIITAYPTAVYPYRPAATGLSPVYLFVAVGTNDLSDGGSPTSAFALLQSYWATAKADGFTVVGFTVLPRGTVGSAYTGDNIELFNSLVRAAPSGSYSILVDENLALSDPYDPLLFQAADTTHPTPAGQAIIASFVNQTFGGPQAARGPFDGRRGSYSTGCDITNLNPSIDTGTFNMGCGIKSLTANTSGSGNTAVGPAVLPVNTTGSSNTGLGDEALWKSTTGNDNTALGYATLNSLLTGGDNTAVGFEALLNSTASDDTALGSFAANQNTTGTGLTAVGKYAAYHNTTANSVTAVGSGALQNNATGAENTAIGSGADGAQTSGDTTAIGYSALANSTAAANTAVGSKAAQISTTATGIVAVGYSADYQNTTGNNNTAVGTSALQSNQTGTDNTGIGTSALNPATGSDNTAVGSGALFSLTTGNDNTGSGYKSGGQMTTAADNVANGLLSLYGDTTGSVNVAVGSSAGRFQADGATALNPNNSVYIGAVSKGKDNSDSNSIVIGYNAIGAGANTAVIGSASTTDVYFGSSTGAANIHGNKLLLASARKGTFVCTAAGTITITNSLATATSDIVITMNTAGGTVTTPPAFKTPGNGTNFTVLCGATDTSTYNYLILD
jgi:hypothetical protein